MSRYFDTVNFLVENLVEDKSSFHLESNEKGKSIFIKIIVDETNMGKLIGKNGRIITSIRTLISSIAKKENKIVKIEHIHIKIIVIALLFFIIYLLLKKKSI